MNIELIEIAGLASALKAMRLPHNGEPKSEIETHVYTGLNSVNYSSAICLRDKDLKLMQNLIRTGDSDSKCVRGILVYTDITAPIHWWVEAETYTVGHTRLSSASTMHTEGKGLQGHALEEVIKQVSYDRDVKKVDAWSYQTLRRMVQQRFNHRKIEWHRFIDWVRTLPLADELILVDLDKQLAVHDEYVRKYEANEI